MPRDPLAWQPLLRHWTHCLGEGGSAIARLGDLEAVPDLDLAALLPGGPGWADVQRCLRHDPDGAFRTLYYGLALRGLEALPAPALLVEPESQQRPRVSVLIPVHNHWPITLNALRSLVVMANGTPFEVILADDASTDATTQLGQQLPWLRIWRSDHNQGFLDTCNGAAELTRGDILLLLNNDVLVADHCLDQIVATFERHPDAGVVGAASWGPDGRPLEVGGIVWADGQVWNHGRGFPPEHWFALEYERQCDYVSGCALGIHRDLWQQLEGFDPRYRPAYCEDTDLCLRVRQAGWSVWVQPAARILHLEGLSHSRSTELGLKGHQLRNLEQLKQRWQYLMDTEQPPDGHPWLLAADRSLFGRPIAVLLNSTPGELLSCQRKGYGVVSLGDRHPDLLMLPSLGIELKSWLLEHLAFGCFPAIMFVGECLDEQDDMPLPLSGLCAQWDKVSTSDELPALSLFPAYPVLSGWERHHYRILASSTGLHADGWLEAYSRLVIEIKGQEQGPVQLRFDFYIPEDLHTFCSPHPVKLDIDSGRHLLFNLSPGLSQARICLPDGRIHVVMVTGPPLGVSPSGSDKRRLLAVLVNIFIEERVQDA